MFLNLFDLSPRELTNSAVWAWILDGLRSSENTSRREIAARLLRTLQVPIPDKVCVLRTEQPLPDGRRIDVYMEAEKEGRSFIFFIENKISTDYHVDSQVAGYLDALSSKECPIYSAILSLSPKIQHQVKESAKFTDERRPGVLDLDQMIDLFNCFELPNDSIPAEFLKHLKGRKQRMTRVRSSLSRGGSDPEVWLSVARQRDVEEEFSQFVDLCSELEDTGGGAFALKYFSGRSIALMGKSNRPLLALHPKKSSSLNGLWLGYNHLNWKYHFGTDFPLTVLPTDFYDEADSKQPNWHFGFFKTPADLSLFFSAFD